MDFFLLVAPSICQALLNDVLPLLRAIFVSASHQTGFDTRSFLEWGYREEKVGHEPRLEPCWTYAGHQLTVQCEPDEPTAGLEHTQYKM